MNNKVRELHPDEFEALRISVASPDDILGWSYGEVTKPETINYRTQKPERDGLFDERIFGPSKDYECYCGKYKKIRYKGIICDKCGVEVTKSSVRRERMGHIELAVPTAHIWYVRGIPSIIGLLLNLSMSDLEKVIYFSTYIILEVNEETRKATLDQLEQEYAELKSKKTVDPTVLETQYKETKKELEHLVVSQLIDENSYHTLSMKYGNIIRVGIGSEAIYELLKQVDLDKEIAELETQANKQAQLANKRKINRRLRMCIDLKRAGIMPSWLITTRLPVLPPDLRPMVQLDGGRFAASDLNDLYRRVINRNNRLKRLLNQGAPEVITRNEKRMLQEAVDALIDNSARRGRNAQTTGAGTRKLRSLSDMLRGKQGRFRQNLLGKRVDYSGRSVIVAGPQLRLNECGLPKIMALELFKPFVISKLIQEGYVHNVKNASRLIEKSAPEVWDILERITSQSYVLLNRAPTLHRLGIQAFRPRLIEGKAIQVHPLVCYAYNADFDGDQMAVHVPLSDQSKWEAENIMQSAKNLLKPASGEPVVQARYDIVFGCFYLTRYKEGGVGEGKLFASKNEAIMAYHAGYIDVRSKIKVRMKDNQLLETSVGRILFNNVLPEGMDYINDVMDNKKLKALVVDVYKKFGTDICAKLVDDIKDLGFEYAAISGLTISMGDVYVPDDKNNIIAETNTVVETVEKQFRRGLIAKDEKNLKVVELWQEAKNKIEKSMIATFDKENPIYLTVLSGARGSFAQIIQMGGMKGLVVSPSGEIISLPIKSNFKEGLDVYEYFISTHGARKGKSDTSLRTSDAGYLTRRLVDVSQDIVISEHDCQTTRGITIYDIPGQEMAHTFEERLVGRVTLKDIKANNKTVVKANTSITKEIAKTIVEAGVTTIEARSPIACRAAWGICQLCYGTDLATGNDVRMGEAAGIIAAQAIGEPGTQLTMQTFHLGGVSGGDITSGLPRVEEIFEARSPRYSAILSEIAGKVSIKEQKEMVVITVTASSKDSKEIELPADFQATVKQGDKVSPKQALATNADKKTIRSEVGGLVTNVTKEKIVVESAEKSAKEYVASPNATLFVKDGDTIEKGAILTEGHIDLSNSLELKGIEFTEAYIVNEVQKIYASQGQNINDKHIEIIVRQMFSKVKIDDSGDSEILSGQIVDRLAVERINTELASQKKKPITYTDIVLGISRVAIKTESFLSAASFQETTGVLLDAAIQGKIDPLKGLKENVIIGRLIPAGTGYRGIGEETDANN